MRQRRVTGVRAEYGDETHWGVPEDSYLVLVRALSLFSRMYHLHQLLCFFPYGTKSIQPSAGTGPGTLLPEV